MKAQRLVGFSLLGLWGVGCGVWVVGSQSCGEGGYPPPVTVESVGPVLCVGRRGVNGKSAVELQNC